jgi:DNA polymerase (family 10)
MSKNYELAAIFYEMSEILEMQEVAWKPRAYLQAALAIEALKQPIEELYKEGGTERLEQIPGVGEAIAKKTEEFLKTGKVHEHQKLLKTIPKHMIDLMRVPGLGPKKIKKLNDILKIKSLADLKKAAKAHKIAELEGFGAKSEKDIIEAIQISKQSHGKIPLKEAINAADKIISQLKKLKELKKIEIAGSTRRKRAFIRDLDILASSNQPKKVIDAFVNMKDIQKILGKGETKATVILKSGIQADIRVLKPESWGAGLYYFTGSKNYNIATRKIAIKKGFKLSEYGLFDKKTGKMVAGKTEEEITKKLGIKLPKPEDRDI